jgi:tellurite resistance protein
MRVFRTLREHDEEARDASRVLAMLETGYLVVRADGVIDPVEYENLLANFREWIQREISGPEFGDMLADLEEDAEREGLFGRLVALREALDLPARRIAFRFAAALAVCDGSLDEREGEVLVQVAAAFELSDDEVEATLSAVDDALASDVPPIQGSRVAAPEGDSP